MTFEFFHENPNMLHVGTTDNHAWFEPLFPKGTSRKTLLNGNWKFRLFPDVETATAYVIDRAETGELVNTEIDVPSVWQHKGIDAPQYVNAKMPIPLDMPYVPKDNPTGVYSRSFKDKRTNPEDRVFVAFEGVDSCFYLWINDVFAGYSQVSHSLSEFDITEYIKSDNTITVMVLKWCDGTYLEDQDKFRETGIFRDVYLVERPKFFVSDYTVKQSFEADYSRAKLTLDLKKNASFEVMVSLLNPDGKKIAETSTTETSLSFTVEDPVLWNAENPLLYTLLIEYTDEKICDEIGLREVRIDGRRFLINGVAAKLKGVNHHDSNPDKGAAINIADLEKDLMLMKQHNINAIRTSHYPKAGVFYKLCDKYGFYVMAEADVESHGCNRIRKDGRNYMEYLAEDPSYKEAILDRNRMNVIQNKNRFCIVMWSMGNESGFGPNFIETAEWIKEYDPQRPIHYESQTMSDEAVTGIANKRSIYKYPNDCLDVNSRMYVPTEYVENYCTKENEATSKPFVQCEFCHAMGNGPGDFEKNILQLYKYDAYFGAFVWEWCDHAYHVRPMEKVSLHPGASYEVKGYFKGKNALKHRYLYGGDFGEELHDGNFCMDGLVYPDRRVHTGLLEYKNVLRPIRLTDYDISSCLFTFKNMLDYSDAAKMFEIKAEACFAGETVKKFSVKLPDEFRPGEEYRTDLSEELKGINASFITFEYCLKKNAFYAKKGYSVGFDQVRWTTKDLYETAECCETAGTLKAEIDSEIMVVEDDSLYYVTQGDTRFVFSKKQGIFSEITKNGKQLLVSPIYFETFRAPTDNDRKIKDAWLDYGYDRLKTRVYSTSIETLRDEVIIHSSFSLGIPSKRPALRLDANWRIKHGGRVVLSLHAKRDETSPFLPRFGLTMDLPKSFNRVKYFGLGPVESYEDKYMASKYGLFEDKVSNMMEDYLKPQENGSHNGVTFLKISGKDGAVRAIGKDTFSFNVSEYTVSELATKKHSFELEKSGNTVLHLDYRQSGIGSNSCGPELSKELRIEEADFDWEIELIFA